MYHSIPCFLYFSYFKANSLIFILNTIKKTPLIPALPKGASFFTHNPQHLLQPLSYCNIPLLSQAPNHNQCKSDLQSIVMSCHYYYSPY